MTACPLCDSTIEKESEACPFCGSGPKTRAKKMGQTPAEKLFKELASEVKGKPGELDLKVARQLLKRGQAALKAGDLLEASRAGHALKKALSLAKRRRGWLDKIAAVRGEMKEASRVGVRIENADAIIKDLEARVQSGQFEGLAQILSSAKKGVSFSGKIKQLERSITAARKKINYSRERGGDITKATEILESAEEALRMGEVRQAQIIIKRAIIAADYARKRAHATQLITGAEKEIQKAADRGADVTEGKEHLKSARRALKSGIYADVQKWTKLARESADRARRARIAEDSIHSVEKLLKEEAKEGSDVEEANPHLEAAWKALEKGKFSEVQASLKRCRRVADKASRVRKAKESLDLLAADLNELRSMKAETSKVEKATEGAGNAFEQKNWRAFRQRVVAARRSARRARRDREKELITVTVEKIVERAGHGGVSAMGARELLAEVEKALGRGRYTDIDALVEAKFEAEATREENKVLREIGDLKTFVAQLKVAGIEVSAAMGLVERAEEALESRDFTQAQKLLSRAGEVAEGLKEAVRDSAGRGIDDLKEELEKLEESGVKVPQASEFQARAKKALADGNSFEALDLARLALEDCKSARKKHFDEIAAKELEEMRSAAELEAAQEKLEEARDLCAVLERGGIDPAPLVEAVSKTENALKADDATNLSFRLQVTAEIVGTMRDSLRNRSTVRLENLEALLKEAEEQEEAGEDLARIRQSLDEGQLELALDLLLNLERKVEEAETEVLREELGAQAQALKAVSSQFVRVKNLLDELSKAGIDVSDSGDRLTEAEAAIEDRDVARASPLLTELEEMASDVKGSLVMAARDVIASARLRLEKAAKHWERIPDAEELLGNAQDLFRKGSYDEAIEVAKLAERKAKTSMERFIDDAHAEVGERIGQIEGRLSHLREVMKDLSRADITIEGAEEALDDIEEALEEGNFEEAETSLAAVEDMGEALASGLKTAAQDLLQKVGETVEEAADEGLSVERGQQVFKTAQNAFDDGRFVEALEYCKVMGDIVDDARQKSTGEDVASYLTSIKADLEELQTKGVTMSKTESVLEEIQETAAKGELKEAKRLADSLSSLVEDIQSAPVFEASAETQEMTDRLEGALDLLQRAQEKVEGGETEEVKEIIAKVMIQLGQEAGGAEALMEDVRDEMDMAERLGADVKEAETLISEAEAAMADEPARAVGSLDKAKKLLVKSVKELVQGAEPELSVEIPEEGLEEGVWNRYQVLVENIGKAPARHVDVTLRGDLEIRGLQPIERIAPGEKRAVELEVKPKESGEMSVDIDVAFRRYFDRKKVLTAERGQVKVSPQGTYVVEDVFLVHSDGRLVNHQSRKPLDEIDEDIFSGMLTVVQDFVRDSFRQRTTVGLKRLEFGESKIIIERGAFAYLACVLLGEEPKLLPLYMAEIINEIEREYGEKLEKWSGLLSEIEGIDAIIRKLIFYTLEEVIRGPEDTESALSSAMSLISGGKALGLDLSEPEELITSARKKVSKEPETALALLQDAVEKALKTQQELQKKLNSGLKSMEDDLSDLATLGMGHEESAGLVEKARRALARGEYDLAARILASLDDSVAALKEQVISKTIEKDLAKIGKTLASLKNKGADVKEPMQLLDKAKEALDQGRIGEVTRRLEEADALARESRRSVLLDSYGQELKRITSIFDEATEAGVVPQGGDDIIQQAREAVERSDVDELELLISEARDTTLAQIEGNLEGKEPRLLVKIPPTGLQAGTWNRLVVEVINRGNWSAKDVEVGLGGDVKVKGNTTINKLEPDEARRLELGLWPQVDREAAIDLEVSYKRSLDDAPFVMRDIREMAVAPKKSYPVEDTLLFLASGELLIHESRTVQEDQDQEAISSITQLVRDFIAKGFGEGKADTIHRLDHGERRVLTVRGERSYLAAIYQGSEPVLLPLYMIQLLKEMEDRFAKELKEWKADSMVLDQLRRVIRRVLLVTEVEGADLGSLSTNPITASLLYGVSPEERRVRAQALLKQVQEGMQKGGLSEGAGVLTSAVDRGVYSIETDDFALKEYIEIVKKVDKAINRARGKAGLELHWPIPRLAIRAANPTVAAAAGSFKAMIMSHANAKEADVLKEGEIWRGVDLKMMIHEDALSKAYKVWAKKIELILKSQDPWKIKAGIDKGGYKMGIEGQVVQILPGMVTFQAIVPPHVVVQEFPGGMVFLDTQMTEETKVEGFANEIIRIVLEARKELALEDSKPIIVKIAARGSLKAIVLSSRDYIIEEVNAEEIQFVQDTGDSGYVVDCEIRDETFTMAVDPA